MVINKSLKRKKITSSIVVHILLVVLCIFWSLPTVGILITSFRPSDEVPRTGWWTVFFREGSEFSLDNYRQVLAGKDYSFVNAEGEKVQASGDNLLTAFLNSLTVTVPAVVIPIPRSIMESAFIDGATHFKTFLRLILPLSMPALASFAIFQFIWVWNDLIVALVFMGAGADNAVLTQRLLNMAGTRGQDWHLLTSGAFVSMILPLIVFFGLQKFFVRGLLAGSVKG